jgi:hypothetical protein
MAYDKAALFKAYVKLRQYGYSMDEAVNKLQDAAQELPRKERHQLGNMVLEWEEKYGADPALSLQAAPTPVQAPPQAPPPPAPPSPAQPPIQRIHANPPETRKQAFGTRFLDPSKVPALSRDVAPPPVSCPHCGTPNPAANFTCSSCGQLLHVRPAPPTRRLDKNNGNPSNSATDYFNQNSTLLIAVQGVKGVLEAFPREKMMIGRGFSPVQGQPFLDLAPYYGETLGVSRYHVEIRFLNNTLVITDLDSDNGTYINGIRLYPYEIRVLHHNDEVRLGKLIMKLAFKVPAKP